jgi:hypothetical protein
MKMLIRWFTEIPVERVAVISAADLPTAAAYLPIWAGF